jgi:hypothetical protein
MRCYEQNRIFYGGEEMLLEYFIFNKFFKEKLIVEKIIFFGKKFN